jgi:hypothetical protein
MKMNAQEASVHVWGIGMRMARNLIRQILRQPAPSQERSAEDKLKSS